MCGIAGVLKIHDPADGPPPPHHDAIPDSWLNTLDASIKHRGPDGQGRFRDRATRPDGTLVDVALIHRRLSIIDHMGGHQPMVHARAADESDLVAVVFNGCIYNHRELRAELEACGHVFETDHSDTEVLIHGWREWGLHMQDHLDGMYACLVWDRRTGQLAVARDMAGEKPVFSSWVDERFIVSSSPAGLTHLLHTTGNGTMDGPGNEIAFERPADSDWPAPCFQLKPRHWRVYPREPKRGGDHAPPNALRSRRLRPLPDRDGSTGLRLGFIPTNEKLVESAITSRLEADVPLGVFLSGGLDSALIAAIAHKNRPDLRAFTVRMPHPEYDESEQAAETAAAIGVDHTILECEPNPADDLVQLIEQLGLPFGDSSLLPTYWVSKAAREHIKVALSGDGGDELFGGYCRHTIAPVLNRWRWLLRLIPTRLLDQRTPGSRSTYLARLAAAARFGGYPELLAIFPTPDMRTLAPMFHEEHNGAFVRTDDPLRHDFETYLPDDLLRKTDTASMAVGLEVRSPFLARELVDAALRTPLDVLMPPRNGRPERKGLLKNVARAYLPDHVIDRPKRGFAIPIGDWFRTDYGGMRTLLHDHLRSADPFPGLADAGIKLDLRFVERMLREHDAAGEASVNPWHGRDHSQRLYMLLVLSIWCRWLDRVRRTNRGQ
ncbi:MAG: asparagine synthase (glutamine-hydrolyzing) [Planctomycetota bacterium]